MRIFPFLLLLFYSVTIAAQKINETHIKNVLNGQVEAWNNGDLNRFMEGYWHNDSLVFIGKNGTTYGWQQTLNNYKKSYPDKEAMGTLLFTILTVQKLSATYYNVIGKWQLTRKAGDLNGYYTLLFKKINDRWLIIQDHSS